MFIHIPEDSNCELGTDGPTLIILIASKSKVRLCADMCRVQQELKTVFERYTKVAALPEAWGWT